MSDDILVSVKDILDVVYNRPAAPDGYSALRDLYSEALADAGVVFDDREVED